MRQRQFSSIFNKSDSNASFEWIITDSRTSPFLFGSFQAHLWSKHVSKAEHGYTDTTKWEESTKPGLIRVGKPQQPCLTLVDLYHNTVHGGQMQAHFAECSTEEEVNKQRASLDCTRDHPITPFNPMMLKPPPPPHTHTMLEVLMWAWVKRTTDVRRTQATCHSTLQ